MVGRPSSSLYCETEQRPRKDIRLIDGKTSRASVGLEGCLSLNRKEELVVAVPRTNTKYCLKGRRASHVVLTLNSDGGSGVICFLCYRFRSISGGRVDEVIECVRENVSRIMIREVLAYRC